MFDATTETTDRAPRAKRTFTAEFKTEAVRLLRERQAVGTTLAAVSRER